MTQQTLDLYAAAAEPRLSSAQLPIGASEKHPSLRTSPLLVLERTDLQGRLPLRPGAKVPYNDEMTKPPKLPPVWFKHLFWRVHRFLYRFTGGRVLWTPRNKRGWGAMHLTTIGRKSGRQRSVIIGYVEDGSTPVALAMNGWDEGEPAWWLNLEVHPDAVIRLKGQPERLVRARMVDGEERDRLWRLWAKVDEGLDSYAASRLADTPVVVFESRDAATA